MEGKIFLTDVYTVRLRSYFCAWKNNISAIVSQSTRTLAINIYKNDNTWGGGGDGGTYDV